jgi:hypothetical protein
MFGDATNIKHYHTFCRNHKYTELEEPMSRERIVEVMKGVVKN